MGHRKTGTRLYQIWCGMKQRCYYPKSNRFKNYGAKGIRVCDRWLDFNKFYEDVEVDYKKHCEEYGERDTTIDRIDNTKNYCKSNCKWSTLWKRSHNRSNNHLLTHKGITKPLIEWRREKGFKRGLIENRLRRGWSIEKTLEEPINIKNSH